MTNMFTSNKSINGYKSKRVRDLDLLLRMHDEQLQTDPKFRSEADELNRDQIRLLTSAGLVTPDPEVTTAPVSGLPLEKQDPSAQGSSVTPDDMVSTSPVSGRTLEMHESSRIISNEFFPASHQGQNKRELKDSKGQIAYVVSVLDCTDEPVQDGAAVLARTIHHNSYQNPMSPSLYDYKLFAFIHKDALDCTHHFTKLGYDVLALDGPVKVNEIRNKEGNEPGFFKKNVEYACGVKEYIKLHIYLLEDYPVVVHMDFNTMLVRSLDGLFDVMLETPGTDEFRTARSKVNFHLSSEVEEVDFNEPIDAFYTNDYTTSPPFRNEVGIQSGLIVVKPSQDRFDELIEIIKQGNYFRHWGWDGSGYGGFLDSMCTKGLLGFYFSKIHPKTSMELDRCVYNTVGDSPKSLVEGEHLCRDSRETCEDCRNKKLVDLKTVNLSICRKPWQCHLHPEDNEYFAFCREVMVEWFKVREQVENGWEDNVDGYTKSSGEGNYHPLYFRHSCDSKGEKGYINMNMPGEGD